MTGLATGGGTGIQQSQSRLELQQGRNELGGLILNAESAFRESR